MNAATDRTAPAEIRVRSARAEATEGRGGRELDWQNADWRACEGLGEVIRQLHTVAVGSCRKANVVVHVTERRRSVIR